MFRKHFCVALLIACAGILRAGFTPFTGFGNPGTGNALAAFEAGIGGANNGNGGPQAGGFRTINWDDVPAPSTNTPLTGSFYQNRGVLLSGIAGGPIQVSSNGFFNFNAGYPALFTPFSGSNIFAPLNGVSTFVTFVAPGTSAPALTRAFGAVFLDANNGATSGITLFDSANNQIGQVLLSGTASGPAFLGLLWDGNGPQIAKVQIVTGNSPIAFGSNQNLPTVDVVALDDFAFAEPQPINPLTPTPVPPSIVLTLIGLTMIGLFVTTRKFARSQSY